MQVQFSNKGKEERGEGSRWRIEGLNTLASTTWGQAESLRVLLKPFSDPEFKWSEPGLPLLYNVCDIHLLIGGPQSLTGVLATVSNHLSYT